MELITKSEFKNGQVVEVTKGFKYPLITCPKKGTVGRVINQDTSWVKVCFWYPFVSNQGIDIKGNEINQSTVIRFRSDEIGLVDNARQ